MTTFVYTPEPRLWCTRCGEYAAAHTLCPVCLDNDRRIAADLSKQASMCRG